MCQDIKPMWLKLARKCQSMQSGARGFSVMEVRVLVGPDGQPVLWFEPEVSKIEPADRAQLFLQQLLERMVE